MDYQNCLHGFILTGLTFASSASAFADPIDVFSYELTLHKLGSKSSSIGVTDSGVKAHLENGYSVKGIYQIAVSNEFAYIQDVVPNVSSTGAKPTPSYFYFGGGNTYDLLGSKPRVRSGDFRKSAMSPGMALFLSGFWQGEQAGLDTIKSGNGVVEARIGSRSTWLFSSSDGKNLIIDERLRADASGPIFRRYTIPMEEIVLGRPAKKIRINMGYPKSVAIRDYRYIGEKTIEDPLGWIGIGSTYRDNRLGENNAVEAEWTGQLPHAPNAKDLPVTSVASFARKETPNILMVGGTLLLGTCALVGVRRRNRRNQKGQTQVPNPTPS